MPNAYKRQLKDKNQDYIYPVLDPADLSGKLDKVSTNTGTFRTYTINSTGGQQTTQYTSGDTGGTIMYRDANGNTAVATPTANNHATTKKYVDDGLANKTNTSVLPNDTNDRYTKFRCKAQGNTGSGTTIQYIKIAHLPVSDGSNGAHVIIEGELGGYGAGDKALFRCLITNRDKIVIFGNLEKADADITASTNKVDIVAYQDSDNTVTVYLKRAGYYVYDFNVFVHGDKTGTIYNGTAVTPTGTEKAKLSTSEHKLEMYDKKLYVSGDEVALSKNIPDVSGKVDVASIDLTGATTTILAELKSRKPQNYVRFVCRTDGGSANISDRPTGTSNAAFECVAILARDNTSASADDYYYHLYAKAGESNNIYTAFAKGADTSFTWRKVLLDLDNSVKTSNINGSAVTTAKIADKNVTAAKIADSTITATQLASNAVTTAKITDANVTTAKLANKAVTPAKIDFTTRPIWSTFVIQQGADNTAGIDYTTLRGTALKISRRSGGTWCSVVSGGANINVVKQTVTARFSSTLTGAFGAGNIKTGSKVYSYWAGASNGAYENKGVTYTAGSSDDFADAMITTGNKGATSIVLTATRLNTTLWSIHAEIQSSGSATSLFLNTEVTTADANHIPTLYQRSATSSNTSFCRNVLEILEE